MNASQKAAYEQWKQRKEKLPALEGQVLRIQSLWRGYVVRKRLHLIKSIFLNGTEGGVFDASIDSEVLFKHDQIKKIYNEFGPFVCEEPSVEELGLPAGAHLVEREPFKLTNGAIYIGQWDNECKRRA